jgi:hypothetical protein
LVVLGVYVGLAFLNSPRGFLGTDTGGKVATMRVMAERGGFDPDLGYWAERSDPTGRFHPLGYTSHTSSGRWVNVTTLPALFVGWELYRVGGYRASLLVPMAGSMAAALAGLALLRRLGVVSDRWRWGGFWVLALASPLTIYALDFWEHSVGVALMAWAVVLLCDALPIPDVDAAFPHFHRPQRRERARSAGAGRGRGGAPRRVLRVAGAGALFGAAATLRTEALAYLAVAGVAWGVVSLRTRARMVVVAGAGAVLLAAAAIPVAANQALEQAVIGSPIRSVRAASIASVAGDQPGSRLREAAVTLVGLGGSDLGIALGLLFAAVLVVAVTRTDRGLAIAAAAAGGAVLVLRAAAAGLGFVPGLVSAWILPAASAASGRADAGLPASARPDVRGLVVAIALGAIPVVLATQFRTGAGPQWAGRYLLTSGLLLAVVGWAVLERRPVALQRAFVALAVAVTVFGLTWTSVRTHDVARAIAALEARPEPVLVSGVYHLAREGGATYGDRRWLTMADADEDADAVTDVLADAGITTFASVELDSPRPPTTFPGFRATDHSTLRLFDGVDLRITSWRSDR